MSDTPNTDRAQLEALQATAHAKQPEPVDGITIANYEMLPHFDPSEFAGVVLDESSILKAFDGKTRTAIIDAFRSRRRRYG